MVRSTLLQLALSEIRVGPKATSDRCNVVSIFSTLNEMYFGRGSNQVKTRSPGIIILTELDENLFTLLPNTLNTLKLGHISTKNKQKT